MEPTQHMNPSVLQGLNRLSEPITIEPETFDPRRAGQVLRYHTWPVHNKQSIAEHSWQVMRILLAICPDAPHYMLVHCMTHDVGETVSGDPPYPTKLVYPELKDINDIVEKEAHLEMTKLWDLPAPTFLTMTEKAIFKFAESMEMLEFGMHELQLGNAAAKLMCTRMMAAVIRYFPQLPVEISGVAHRYFLKRLAYHNKIMKDGREPI